MGNLFNEILYRPLFNALIFLYQYFPLHDLGIAIILLTILIRIVLLPLFYKGAKDQAVMQRLAPKIKEIQKNHKADKEKQAKALLDLYREHRVNPMSGFLLLLIQLPILIALYQVFLKGLSDGALGALYSFVSRPDVLNHYFLGFIDLSQRSISIVVLAAIAQFFQSKLMLPKTSGGGGELSTAERVSRQMVYLGPVITVIFLVNLPSAIGLYWLTTSAFSVIQQIAINRKLEQNGGITK